MVPSKLPLCLRPSPTEEQLGSEIPPPQPGWKHGGGRFPRVALWSPGGDCCFTRPGAPGQSVAPLGEGLRRAGQFFVVVVFELGVLVETAR